MKAAATCSNKPLKVSKILFENIKLGLHIRVNSVFNLVQLA